MLGFRFWGTLPGGALSVNSWAEWAKKKTDPLLFFSWPRPSTHAPLSLPSFLLPLLLLLLWSPSNGMIVVADICHLSWWSWRGVNRGRKEGGGKRKGVVWCAESEEEERGEKRGRGGDKKGGEKEETAVESRLHHRCSHHGVTSHDHLKRRAFFFSLFVRPITSRVPSSSPRCRKEKKSMSPTLSCNPFFYFLSLHHAARMMGCNKKKGSRQKNECWAHTGLKE